MESSARDNGHTGTVSVENKRMKSARSGDGGDGGIEKKRKVQDIHGDNDANRRIARAASEQSNSDGSSRQLSPRASSNIKPAASSSSASEATSLLNSLAAKAMKAKLKKDFMLHDELQQQITSLRQSLASVSVAAPSMRPNVVDDKKSISTIPQRPVNAVNADAEQSQPRNHPFNPCSNARAASNQQRRPNPKLLQYTSSQLFSKFDSKEVIGSKTLDMSVPSPNAGEEANNETNDGADSTEAQLKSELFGRCHYCTGSSTFAAHTVISHGVRLYLAIPRKGYLGLGHCLIIPYEHICSYHDADSLILEELQYWKRHLVKCFAAFAPKCVPVFIETATNLSRLPHALLHVIPISTDLNMDAPILYKQALTASEGEWTDNRKIIPLSKVGISSAIPSNFPYFAVEFSSVLQSNKNSETPLLSSRQSSAVYGYAHVIESEDRWNKYFGIEVLLDSMVHEMDLREDDIEIQPSKTHPNALEEHRFCEANSLGLSHDLRTRMRSSYALEQHEKERVQRFKNVWKKFDWTRKAPGGDLYQAPSDASAASDVITSTASVDATTASATSII